MIMINTERNILGGKNFFFKLKMFAILATLMIATPVFSEFRYAYSLFTTTPLLFIIPFTEL